MRYGGGALAPVYLAPALFHPQQHFGRDPGLCSQACLSAAKLDGYPVVRTCVCGGHTRIIASQRAHSTLGVVMPTHLPTCVHCTPPSNQRPVPLFPAKVLHLRPPPHGHHLPRTRPPQHPSGGSHHRGMGSGYRVDSSSMRLGQPRQPPLSAQNPPSPSHHRILLPRLPHTFQP